jgi:hypothetical protein
MSGQLSFSSAEPSQLAQNFLPPPISTIGAESFIVCDVALGHSLASVGANPSPTCEYGVPLKSGNLGHVFTSPYL